ncbi:MAG: lipid IV(A) 3-deoxy-D-manno-octulosonic acid transferase [Gammaproteobacteria bacterium]|nr:lipid IV(A) 3-deoxy-D-manno-octulosonic acid transferase [Gammaproteobacteria bacterium]
MIRLLYQVLLWLVLPAVLLRLEWRARREPEYGRRVGERMGRVPARVPGGCVWFHAVSAGETIAVAQLIADLAAEFAGDGGAPMLVTTTPPTGSAQVAGRLGDSVHHCYAPYDFLFAVRSFFDKVQPRVLVLVETELWPNLIHEAHRRGVPVLLVNARLSAKSARGYGFVLVRCLTRSMLREVALVACQYDDTLERYKSLGLPGEKAVALGSVKFDARLPDDHADQSAALHRALGLQQRHVWIAGSTHPGEDELVLDAHARVRERSPESCLLLAPRHPVRGREICGLARRRGFSVLRMGASGSGDPDAPSASADVVVCDTMGQLQTLYGLSELAFIGGSLVPVGGHNPIEAALCRQPLAMGPHTWNFDEVVAAFAEADCLARVQTAAQLGEVVIAAFKDEEARAAAGAHALQVVEENRGATARLFDLLRTRIRATLA